MSENVMAVVGKGVKVSLGGVVIGQLGMFQCTVDLNTQKYVPGGQQEATYRNSVRDIGFAFEGVKIDSLLAAYAIGAESAAERNDVALQVFKDPGKGSGNPVGVDTNVNVRQMFEYILNNPLTFEGIDGVSKRRFIITLSGLTPSRYSIRWAGEAFVINRLEGVATDYAEKFWTMSNDELNDYVTTGA